MKVLLHCLDEPRGRLDSGET
eukprot:COSAG02_NODE_7450_length_3008_cov_1.793056_1_plen_20_part_10